MILAGLIVANIGVFNVVVRRHGFTVAIAEIPLVLALYYLTPAMVIGVSALALVVTQLRQRLAPVKLWFNAAKTTAAASTACLVLAALPDLRGVGPGTWGILFAAVAMNSLVSLAAVAGVIAVVQGRQAGQEAVRAAMPTVVTVAINVAVGLIFLIALDSTGWAAVLLGVLVAAVVFVYRSYAGFFRQHRTLSEVYELTKAMTDAAQHATLLDALLVRVRALMQAEYATLWLPAQGRHPEVLLTSKVEASGLLDSSHTPLPIRERAMETKRSVAVGARVDGDQDLRSGVRAAGLKDVIVVPLRSGKAVIGTLEVVNRLGDLKHFMATDIQVLETVAAHAAVAVENSRLVDRLRYDAYHDRVTGLPNRRRVADALAASVKVRAPGEVVAVLMFDVDGLRNVNEAMGHEAGDQLLVEIGQRLRRLAASGALVGRVGGDEFVVTLRTDGIDEATALALRLREQLREPMTLGTVSLDVDTVVGVAVHPDHGVDPEALLQRADLAANAAKTLPCPVQPFTPALESRVLRRLGLAAELQRALDVGEIEIYFQPKVTLADRRLVGVECLARWDRSAHGPVDPADFVAIAERTGQIGRLTEVALREALRRCRDWGRADRRLSVAVNVATRSLGDPRLADWVAGLLAEYGVPAELLTFEFSEAGIAAEPERVLPTLTRLRDLGVRLSVDDFGTGASSLALLRRLPVHEIKIDNSFVQGMVTDSGDLATVRAVISLSREFGLSVVAEGVESERTLALLEQLDCEVGQGFLFSRPLPYERLEAWFGARTDPERTPAGEIRRLRAVP